MDTEKLQKLNLIELKLLSVAGYLNMLHQLRAIHPQFIGEYDQHMDELGTAMKTLLEVKDELGAHSHLKIVPEP